MKFLLKSKRDGVPEGQKENKVSKSVQVLYTYVQGAWADWMGKRTVGLSSRSLKIVLALFVLLTGGYCIYLTVHGFIADHKMFSIIQIKKLGHLTETGDAKTAIPNGSAAEYRRIHYIKMYMDSLARSPTGRTAYDSITYKRPGLMDSLRYIDSYYQHIKNR